MRGDIHIWDPPVQRDRPANPKPPRHQKSVITNLLRKAADVNEHSRWGARYAIFNWAANTLVLVSPTDPICPRASHPLFRPAPKKPTAWLKVKTSLRMDD